MKFALALGLHLSAVARDKQKKFRAQPARRPTAEAAFGDATPSNKPLEWTGRHQVDFNSSSCLPATQGQR